jgi:hypothetical protein
MRFICSIEDARAERIGPAGVAVAGHAVPGLGLLRERYLAAP